MAFAVTDSEGELSEQVATEFFSVVQIEGKRDVSRKVKYNNLDFILSVGYRVSSKRGTQFRIWANKILKDYLIEGFSTNEKLLKEKIGQLDELKHTVKLLKIGDCEQGG